MLALGFSYHMGWSCVALISCPDSKRIEVLKTGRIETGRPDDRSMCEPYHVAGGWQGLERVPVPGDPEKIVQAGLRQQRRHTLTSLRRFLSGHEKIDSAGILTGRGKRAENLKQALNSHAQIHVAESHAVHDALTHTLSKLDIVIHSIDKKTLYEQAAAQLGMERSSMLDLLKELKPKDGPWRQEEKTCVIAAWLSIRAD